MNFFQLIVPTFLLVKKNIVGIITFTAIFALAFLNFYKPFNVEIRYELNKIQILTYSSLIILLGVGVIVISRIVMYQLAKFRGITYGSLIIFMFCEVAGMALFFTFIGEYTLHDARDFLDVFKASARNTALVLLIPYTVTWLYYAWREKSEQLKMMSENNASEKISSDKMISFYDDKGTLRFSVVLADLLYLEASDNYVSIHYKSGGKIAKYMVRNTLKKLETDLVVYQILRCHRSYLINSKKVRLLRREKDGLFIELNTEQEIKLPVSKTYVSTVVESLSVVSD